MSLKDQVLQNLEATLTKMGDAFSAYVNEALSKKEVKLDEDMSQEEINAKNKPDVDAALEDAKTSGEITQTDAPHEIADKQAAEEDKKAE